MTLINFSHPITPGQLAAVEQITGSRVECVLDVKAQFDHDRPFAEQARALADAIGLSPQEWQTLPLVINPPSLHSAAVVVLAELHGRMGYFPTIVRLRPKRDGTPPQYEVAEIVNLQHIRDAARSHR